MDLFWTAFGKDKESIGFEALYKYRHRLIAALILVDFQYFPDGISNQNISDNLRVRTGLDDGLTLEKHLKINLITFWLSIDDLH